MRQTVNALLRHPATIFLIGDNRLRSMPSGVQQMGVFRGNQEIPGKRLIHSANQLQRFVVYSCSRRRNNASAILRVPGNLWIAMGRHLPEILQAFLLIAADAHYRRRDLRRPTQASDHVKIDAQHILGIHIIRIEFQHTLMVMASPDARCAGPQTRHAPPFPCTSTAGHARPRGHRARSHPWDSSPTARSDSSIDCVLNWLTRSCTLGSSGCRFFLSRKLSLA